MVDPSFYNAHATMEHEEQIFLEITEGPAAETDDFVMDGNHFLRSAVKQCNGNNARFHNMLQRAFV